MRKTLIKNSLIIDGTGSAAYQADILINGNRIAAVASHLDSTGMPTIIDATGLVLCPGFIDVHSHSDISLLAAPEATGKLSQGVTTDIAGNCGLSPFPATNLNRDHLQKLYDQYDITISWSNLTDYSRELTKRQPAINLMSLTGHNTLRAAVTGYRDKVLSENELNEMCLLLDQQLQQGAGGFSTGLLYIPGKYASETELLALLNTLSSYKRPYTTHLRSEGAQLEEAIAEAISLCRNSGQSQLHISHLKASGRDNWHKLNSVIQQFETAPTSLSITTDRYPYTESMTQLCIILPPPYDGMGASDLTNHLNEAANFATFLAELALFPEERWQTIRLVNTTMPPYQPYIGRKLAKIATILNQPPHQICADLLHSDSANCMAAFSGMCEDNMKRIMALPYCCCGSDESARPETFDFGRSHPRGFGSFPQFINILTPALPLEQIIHKLTGLPAAIFNLKLRGLISPGYIADLVLFNPNSLSATADFTNPHQLTTGIDKVWVNGTLSYSEGKRTGQRAGQFIRC